MATASIGRAGADAGPSLEDFATAFLETNPFARQRVSEATDRGVDVAEINGKAFDRLTRLAVESLRDRRGIGVTLLGTAGVGKSHLLARLYRWAAESAADGSPRAQFAFLHNLMADPDRLPRYVLKCVVANLSEFRARPPHLAPLYRLVHEVVWSHLREQGIQKPAISDAEGALFRCFEDCPVPIRPEVARVLVHYMRFATPKPAAGKDEQEYRRYSLRAAIDWLSGDEIDEKAAKTFGLSDSPERPTMLRDDQDVEAVLHALSELAARDRKPFIVCIDQVEGLDPDKMRSLNQFLHCLIDHSRNLLVAYSGVKTNIYDAKDAGFFTSAVWDRIAENVIELNALRPAEARKLVEARIEAALEPFSTVQEVNRHLKLDTLFPLGKDWFDESIGSEPHVRPRQVLVTCREHWEAHSEVVRERGVREWLEGWNGCTKKPPPPPVNLENAVDALVDQKIEELIYQRHLNPAGLPVDAGNLKGLIDGILKRCTGVDAEYSLVSTRKLSGARNRLPQYDLHVEEKRRGDGARVITALTCVTNEGRSATESLRRLLMADQSDSWKGGELDHRLLVTEEERKRLTVGPTGIGIYNQLRALGSDRFRHIKLTFHEYAQLDALEGVVGLAESGDLEVEWPRGQSRPVTEAEVIDSHHRKDRYRAHPLLRLLLTEEFPEGSSDQIEVPKPLLDQADFRSFALGLIGWRLGMGGKEILHAYLKVLPPPPPDEPRAWEEAKGYLTAMHTEGLLHAQPNDDDLQITRNS